MNIKDIMTLGAIATSVLVMGAFLTGLLLVYIRDDSSGMELYTGAVIANATTAVGFWLGSSAGSQKKDERMAAANGTPPKAG